MNQPLNQPLEQPPRRSLRTQDETFDLVGNIDENLYWMTRSRWFLREGWFLEEVRKAFDILRDKEHAVCKKFDLEDFTIGPALPYAFWANYIIWGFFFAGAVFGVHLVSADEANPVATTPQRGHLVVGIASMIVFLGWSLHYEVCAAFYVLPTQGCAVDREAVGNKDPKKDKESMLQGNIKFDKWMALMLLMSFILHADVYTTSIFVARVRKSSECDFLEKHWSGVLSKSNYLQGLAGHLTFLHLVYFAWFGMFCQFLFALMYSWPTSKNNLRDMQRHEADIMLMEIGRLGQEAKRSSWCCQSDLVKVSTGRVEYDMVKRRDQIAQYHTIAKSKQRHGRALQALADSGRMNCLSWQDDRYLDEAERHWDLATVQQEMSRVNVRFFLFALQAVLVPNLQVTLLGMQAVAAAHHGGDKPDWFTFTSITLSVFLGLRYGKYELVCMRRHGKFIRNAFLRAAKEAAEKCSNVDLSDALYRKKRANFSWWFNMAMFMIFVILFFHLLVKAFMGMLVCPHHVWNVAFMTDGEFDWKAGCVNVNDVEKMNVCCGSDCEH